MNQKEHRELRDDELDLVCGGLKWQSGTVNPDVVDARGGHLKTVIGTFTLDANGKISGFSPRT